MAYGIIKVDPGKGKPLTLTFSNKDAWDDTLSRLRTYAHRHPGKMSIADAFWGYELFESAEAAIALARVYLDHEI